MASACDERCCEGWRQEVGLSVTAALARFADPRLHVINSFDDHIKYLPGDLESLVVKLLPAGPLDQHRPR